MLLESFAVGPLACICSIVADTSSRAAVVIDPGGDLSEIRARLERHNLTVKAILLTHAHIDHVGAAAELQRLTGAPVRIHPDDHFLLRMLTVQAAMVGLPQSPQPDATPDLVDGAVETLGALELAVMHTPGHSPGSISLLLRGGAAPVLFSGDTLFQGGIGRSDLWGGDHHTLLRSIRTRLYTLDPSVRVIAGHGDETTIGEEMKENPFVRATP
jgi:glyoxylase-like metal-dependent hydrolase (beta-lactamase superfamily II)